MTCSVVGCGRRWPLGAGSGVLSDGVAYCNEHWSEANPPVVQCQECGRGAVTDHDSAPITQKCGVCGRRVCADCYGEWNALACRECRERARGKGC